MFHRILVTTGGSATSHHALRPAAELARRCGATLTLLHVVLPPMPGAWLGWPSYGYGLWYDREEAWERRREDGLHLLDEARCELDVPGAGVMCLKAQSGAVARAIADEVERDGLELSGLEERFWVRHTLFPSVYSLMLSLTA